ncbi:hypothetical protein R3P38DRAFT_3470671 [Favolaschia claudopus]|uniref:Uncharacterized protein n=1 Tax=Favolaschia claudopus TaxID=2862362 RepID=A0AAV9ZDZ5_9AGAR
MSGHIKLVNWMPSNKKRPFPWKSRDSEELRDFDVPFALKEYFQNIVGQLQKNLKIREWGGWRAEDLQHQSDDQRQARKARLTSTFSGLLTGPHGADLEKGALPLYILSANVDIPAVTTPFVAVVVLWKTTDSGRALTFFNNHLDSGASFESFALDGESTSKTSEFAVGEKGKGFILATQFLVEQINADEFDRLPHDAKQKDFPAPKVSFRVGSQIGQLKWSRSRRKGAQFTLSVLLDHLTTYPTVEGFLEARYHQDVDASEEGDPEVYDAGIGNQAKRIQAANPADSVIIIYERLARRDRASYMRVYTSGSRAGIARRHRWGGYRARGCTALRPACFGRPVLLNARRYFSSDSFLSPPPALPLPPAAPSLLHPPGLVKPYIWLSPPSTPIYTLFRRFFSSSGRVIYSHFSAFNTAGAACCPPFPACPLCCVCYRLCLAVPRIEYFLAPPALLVHSTTPSASATSYLHDTASSIAFLRSREPRSTKTPPLQPGPRVRARSRFPSIPPHPPPLLHSICTLQHHPSLFFVPGSPAARKRLPFSPGPAFALARVFRPFHHTLRLCCILSARYRIIHRFFSFPGASQHENASPSAQAPRSRSLALSAHSTAPSASSVLSLHTAISDLLRWPANASSPRPRSPLPPSAAVPSSSF